MPWNVVSRSDAKGQMRLQREDQANGEAETDAIMGWAAEISQKGLRNEFAARVEERCAEDLGSLGAEVRVSAVAIKNKGIRLVMWIAVRDREVGIYLGLSDSVPSQDTAWSVRDACAEANEEAVEAFKVYCDQLR